jgi:hypothetical protein
MSSLWRSLLHDERGFVLTAELIIISTVLVLGLITAFSALQTSVVAELTDVGSAIGSMNQSYVYRGMHGCCCYCGPTSRTFGSSFLDVADTSKEQQADFEAYGLNGAGISAAGAVGGGVAIANGAVGCGTPCGTPGCGEACGTGPVEPVAPACGGCGTPGCGAQGCGRPGCGGCGGVGLAAPGPACGSALATSPCDGGVVGGLPAPALSGPPAIVPFPAGPGIAPLPACADAWTPGVPNPANFGRPAPAGAPANDSYNNAPLGSGPYLMPPNNCNPNPHPVVW